MYCKKFMTFIERYRDKVLSVENRSACDEHLSACPRCSRALAEIERTTTLFAQALIPAAPVDLTADIMKSVRRDSADLESQTGIAMVEGSVPVRPAGVCPVAHPDRLRGLLCKQGFMERSGRRGVPGIQRVRFVLGISKGFVGRRLFTIGTDILG
jgi:hypothetical protein